MKKTLEELWTAALENLKTELSAVSVNTWFHTATPLRLNGNIITIGVPNDFSAKVWSERYANMVENTLKDITNNDYIVEVKMLEKNPSQKTHMENTSKNDGTAQFTTSLNPKYTFDHFVIGESNRFAHAAALAAAKSPGETYNPLFIYGGVGLGKTHLMQAIGNYMLQENPELKVVYVSSETFTNDLINSILKDRNSQFRDKYRNVDVLLVDDVQFIAGKESTQEEFFHTFNTLYDDNKQLVMTSDKPPKEIPELEERVRSRFEWGLSADIQPPDLETRIAILKKKAEIERFFVSDEVMVYIAENMKSNIRELEGALTKVMAYSTLSNQDATINLAEKALKDIMVEAKPKEIDIEMIKEIIAKHFGITVEDLESKKRPKNISYPRQIAMHLARDLTDLSLPKIGEAFGGRDHTTVIYAYDKIEKDKEIDELFRNEFNIILKKITD
ncbi:MAG: chromosomal replication initiator protein DnaA [Andreesenia angusta]|nr:chromosomal replication initiator protein DnaA [Andreesenia angusta]